jgi:hypothetical protein
MAGQTPGALADQVRRWAASYGPLDRRQKAIVQDHLDMIAAHLTGIERAVRPRRAAGAA